MSITIQYEFNFSWLVTATLAKLLIGVMYMYIVLRIYSIEKYNVLHVHVRVHVHGVPRGD